MSVAVVIPVWDDYVAFLPDAVASVRAQGDAVAQVVVVDNASQMPVPQLDGTTIVRAPQRLTTGAARNLGLAQVAAEHVVFLDADDVLLPGAIGALAAGLRPGVVVFGLAILDGDTGRRHRSPRTLARRLAARPRAFALANAVWSLLPTQGATIMRTRDVRDAGGYADRSQGEDWALAVGLAWRGRVAFGDEPALVYRWRGDSPGRAGTRAPLLTNARCIRERIRDDAQVPAGVRATLPLIALLQWLAVVVVRPLWRGLRHVRPAR